MVESTPKEFGKIDVLVNNANINFPIKPQKKRSLKMTQMKNLGLAG